MAEPRKPSSPPTGRGREEEEGTAKAQATKVKRKGRETAESLKSEAKGKKEELKAEAKEKARELKETAAGEVEEKASEAADRLDGVIRALQAAADRLDEDGETWLSGYVRQAAGQVDRMTGYLRDRDAGRMVQDLEAMARENPGTFLGTSFASGVALGRFLRASSPSKEVGDGEAEPGSGGYGFGDESVGRAGSTAGGSSGRWGAGPTGSPTGARSGGVRTGSAARASDAAGSLGSRGAGGTTGRGEE